MIQIPYSKVVLRGTQANPVAFTDIDGHLFMLRSGFTPYAADLKQRVTDWCLQFQGQWTLSQEQIDENNRGPHDFTVKGIDRNNKPVSHFNPPLQALILADPCSHCV
jgi:hypothetical protein